MSDEVARSIFRRSIAPALAAGLLAAGCGGFTWTGADGTEEDSDNILGWLAAGTGRPPEKSRASSGPSDVLLSLRTRKRADGDAFGFVRFHRNVYPPFRVSLVGGLADPAASTGFAGNSQVCIELDARGTITGVLDDLRFVVMCARSEGDGMRVRAQDKFVQYGNRFFPGTKVVQMTIAHDGGDLVFLAGPAAFDGGAALVEVARVPNFAVADAYLPALGASFLGFPAEVSFDRCRIEASGEPPASRTLTAAQRIAHDLYPALDGLLEALYDLDGFTPDTASARARIVAAQGVLDAALTAIDATIERGSQSRKARGRARGAAAAAAASLAKIDKGKSQIAIARQVTRALGLALGTVDVLDPVGP